MAVWATKFILIYEMGNILLTRDPGTSFRSSLTVRKGPR